MYGYMDTLLTMLAMLLKVGDIFLYISLAEFLNVWVVLIYADYNNFVIILLY
jgi:hypothetical protein